MHRHSGETQQGDRITLLEAKEFRMFPAQGARLWLGGERGAWVGKKNLVRAWISRSWIPRIQAHHSNTEGYNEHLNSTAPSFSRICQSPTLYPSLSYWKDTHVLEENLENSDGQTHSRHIVPCQPSCLAPGTFSQCLPAGWHSFSSKPVSPVSSAASASASFVFNCWFLVLPFWDRVWP